MTTKEFIKMLQEADPSGDAHVRLPGGGVPIFAELKQGYWDGPYSYLNNGVFHTTSKGMKVDLYVVTPTDIVWDEKGDLEKLKTRFSHDYGNYAAKEQIQEKEAHFWKYIEREADTVRSFKERSLKEWTQKLKKLIYQKGIDTFYFNRKTVQWSGYCEGIQVHGQLCGGEIDAVTKSGLFILTEETAEKKVYTIN